MKSGEREGKWNLVKEKAQGKMGRRVEFRVGRRYLWMMDENVTAGINSRQRAETRGLVREHQAMTHQMTCKGNNSGRKR